MYIYILLRRNVYVFFGWDADNILPGMLKIYIIELNDRNIHLQPIECFLNWLFFQMNLFSKNSSPRLNDYYW